VSIFIGVIAATPDSGGDWGLVAAIATALAAVAALAVREFQRRREDLDQKVANAVSAGLGRTLLEFRDIEAGAKASLDAVLNTATGIEGELRERLEVSETHSKRLAELLEAAADVVPQLEQSKAALPTQLVIQAMNADQDTALSYLSALLNSELASADDLTTGGNIASRRFGASALALDFYSKALEANPRDADAAASAVRLRARAGQITLEEGIVKMTEILSEHPRDRDAISEALNLFVEFDDYQGMLDFVDQRLENDPTNPLLWRNRGIALMELRRPKDEVIEAYSKSFELALEHGTESEASNSARPYAGFLIRMHELAEAESIIERALVTDPESAQLLLLRGQVEAASGQFKTAEWCYTTAITCARSPSEAATAEADLRKLRALQTLSERGVVSADLLARGVAPRQEPVESAPASRPGDFESTLDS
jgi:tetratricopeptide (TPR) repeat protein